MTSPAVSAKPTIGLRPEVLDVCVKAIHELRAETTGVISVTVSTSDGFTVASTLEQGVESDKVSAMTSSISALSTALSRQTGRGMPNNLVLEANLGKIVAMNVPGARERLVLAVVTNEAAVLGQLLWSCRAICERIARAINP